MCTLEAPTNKRRGRPLPWSTTSELKAGQPPTKQSTQLSLPLPTYPPFSDISSPFIHLWCWCWANRLLSSHCMYLHNSYIAGECLNCSSQPINCTNNLFFLYFVPSSIVLLTCQALSKGFPNCNVNNHHHLQGHGLHSITTVITQLCAGKRRSGYHRKPPIFPYSSSFCFQLNFY